MSIFYLSIIAVPSAPMDLINTSTTYNSVSLSWSSPTFLSGVPIENYKISISPDPLNGTCSESQCVVPSTNTTITNLQYGVEHEVSLVAVTCAGISNPTTLRFTIVAQGYYL